MTAPRVQGYCDPRFQSVLKAVEDHLSNPREYGCALSAFVDDQPVVDLWGGYTDDRRELPWQKDTIICLFSTGKCLGALCVLRLVDQGRIGLDDPVSKYWPAFSRGDKSKITIRHVLSHLSGIVYLDDLEPGSCFNYPALVRAVEEKEPDWVPGTQLAYHTFTIGILTREIVFRATGMHIDEFWRQEFAEPLGLDYMFVLNPEEQARCATVYADADDAFLTQVRDSGSTIGRAWKSLVPGDGTAIFNSQEIRSWGVPNLGFGNPRALARIFAALARGGKIDGIEVISEGLLAETVRCHWDGEDALLEAPLRHGLGFILGCESFPFTGNPDCLIALGAGGASAVADPGLKLSISYAPVHMGPDLGDAVPIVKKVVELFKELL